MTIRWKSFCDQPMSFKSPNSSSVTTTGWQAVNSIDWLLNSMGKAIQ